MGVYLNPSDLKVPFKAAWMDKQVNDGLIKEVTADGLRRHHPAKDGRFGLAFVANGWMDAIGIATTRRDADVMTDPTDTRPQRYGIAHIKDIARWDYAAAEKTLRIHEAHTGEKITL